MWALQSSRVCFMLLESRGISACRNKRASSSVSGWERKNTWCWCLPSSCSSPPPPPTRHPLSTPSLLTTAKAAWLLLAGSSWRLYLSTSLMCKLSSSVNREVAINVFCLPGQSPTEWRGSQVINAQSSGQPPGSSCPGISLECAVCQCGSMESVVP